MTAASFAAAGPQALGDLISYGALELRRAFRNRRYLLFGIGFPVVFYLLYTGVLQRGQPVGSIEGTPWPAYFMVSMAAYGAMVAGLSSAQVIAAERGMGWVRLLRVTPLPAWAYVLTKFAVSLVVTLPSVIVVLAAGVLVNHIAVDPVSLVGIAVGLSLGSLPFAALGILIGYRFDTNSVQGAVMITNFSLAILGGLWAPRASFPDGLATIADVLPSSHFANLGRAALAGSPPGVVDVAIIAAYTVVIGTLVVWAYRRDEQRARG